MNRAAAVDDAADRVPRHRPDAVAALDQARRTPSWMPKTSSRRSSAVRTTARTAAFMPDASPPLVSTPTRLMPTDVAPCASTRHRGRRAGRRADHVTPPGARQASAALCRFHVARHAVNSNAREGGRRTEGGSTLQNELRAWTVNDSIELYNVGGWGVDFFSINEAGNVSVSPAGPGDDEDRPQGTRRRPLQPGPESPDPDPVLRHPAHPPRAAVRRVPAGHRRERVPGRVPRRLPGQGEPAAARRRGADGVRPPVQPRESKPGRSRNCWSRWRVQENPEALILCNGYKDRAFIETALLAQKLGRRVVITIDRLGEVETILAAAAELSLRPVIGVRARLLDQGRRQVGRLDGRPVEVRPDDRGDHGDGEPAARGGDARLPAAAALPHRVADHQHPRGEGRAARVEPHLRRAVPPGREHALPRLRRRPRRGLRRQPHQLPLVGQLHAAGIRGRHRRARWPRRATPPSCRTPTW